MKGILNKFFKLPKNFYRIENKYLIIASLGGLGYIRKAPGTVASLVTVLFALLLNLLSPSLLVIVITLMFVVGFFVCEQVYASGFDDPSYVVIDEFVGQSIPFLLVGINIYLAIVAFVFFRLLDITKPWIIGKAEKYFQGGTAIMMDDILAGFGTLLIVIIASLFIT